MGTVIIEGIGACFILLLVCVVGISNGAVGLAHLYEKDVQERAIKLGLTTAEKIKRNALILKFAGLIPLVTFIIISVYCVNGARGFREPFWQISIISLIEGIFDRIFIDWYWVGKTKAWDIPGTEDLKPYISGKPVIIKWIITLVGCPLAKYAKKYGYTELMPHMCALDHKYAKLLHTRLIRTHTVATGAESCDYRYVPDKNEFAKNYKGKIV